MSAAPRSAADEGTLVRQLMDAGWAAASGAEGTLAWTSRFEQVIAELQHALPAQAVDGPAWYPPVMPRVDAERAGYAETFLDLLGTVYALPEPAPGGTDPGRADPDAAGWALAATDVVLVPAMCYHIYPALAGEAVSRLRTFDLTGYCYRHEKTRELGRLRTYRVREHLAVGPAGGARQWRDEQLQQATAFFGQLGLHVRVQAAADPFFGRAGRIMKSAQLEQRLKFELVHQLSSTDEGTAIASANYHKDYFGAAFGIRLAEGGTAHSACLGFGLERIALALIHTHGHDRGNWPDISSPTASPRGQGL